MNQQTVSFRDHKTGKFSGHTKIKELECIKEIKKKCRFIPYSNRWRAIEVEKFDDDSIRIALYEGHGIVKLVAEFSFDICPEEMEYIRDKFKNLKDFRE